MDRGSDQAQFDWAAGPTESVEVCRLPRLLHRFVMIDGPPRVGKTTLSKIVASFEKVELERIEEIYDYVGYLHSLGKIERDAAIALLRTFADNNIYNLYLSRNVNCRFGDQSSIFKSPHPLRYIRRMFAAEHNAATDAILADNPIMQQHAHFQMEHIDIHFDAHPETLRVIEVLRHPADLVRECEARGYGENVGESLNNVLLCLRARDTAVHMLARGWEVAFLDMKPIDRVIKLLHGYQLRACRTYGKLLAEKKDRVFVCVFEDVISDPETEAERLAAFLETRTTRATRKIVRRIGKSYRPSIPDRQRNYREIETACSIDSLALPDEMIANYENRWVN